MGRTELLEEFGFEKEEYKEISYRKEMAKTGFPLPYKSYRLIWEVSDLSLEEPYFWILDTLKESFGTIEKIEDSFSASENSAFFGVTQQKLGAQQDKISQFLATSGKMVKELFQMVRELRIIDERLAYYDEVDGEFSKPVNDRKKGGVITLKGIFVDLVQGGGKSAASVYGMARELEFITLPDLFFDAPPFHNTDELEAHIKGLEKDFNQNVLRVLIRHLRQFMEWRYRTHKEHMNRKRFMLQYLRQHFEIIQMYLNWVKPYLRTVQRLSLKEKNMDSADMIGAFEGSMLDIEILARKRENGANGCVLATFQYRTRPEMKFVQEGYQRGPVHVGKFDMNLRMYFWTDEEVENYKKLKKKESLQLMGEISSSVRAAMEALGDELDVYLEESGALGEKEEEKKTEKKKAGKGLFETFLGDFYTPKAKLEPGMSAKELKAKVAARDKSMKGFKVPVTKACWNTYNNFKKAHRMTTW